MKVIYVANQKGGVGKSTFLAQLATLLAELGYRVVIIDSDPQATVKNWFLSREETNIAGWDVAFADLGLYIQEMRSTGEFDYMLVDTAGVHTQAISAQLRLADLVIIPVQPTVPDLNASAVTASFLKQHNIPYLFVLNRAKSRDKDTMDAVLTLARTSNVCRSLVFDRKAYARCMAFGVSAWAYDPKTPCREEIYGVWKDLIEVFPQVNMELPVHA